MNRDLLAPSNEGPVYDTGNPGGDGTWTRRGGEAYNNACITPHTEQNKHKYHNMKGKKEDDDNRQKSTNESTRANHFADLLVHVELEQLSNSSRIQPKPAKEERRA